MKKRAKTAVITVIILLLCFIWGHSLASAEVSEAESKSVMTVLTPLLELFAGKGNVTDHLVRKLAHFAEFAALGFFVALLSLLCLKRKAEDIYHCLLDVLAAAVVDETVQLLSPGRAGMVEDVLLDTAGGAFGIVILCLLALLFRSTEKRNDRNER